MKLRDLLKKPSEILKSVVDSHEFKVGYIKAYRKTQGVRKVLRALLLNEDPWALLDQMGVSRLTPIKHGAFTGDQTVVFLAGEFDEATLTFVPLPVTAKIMAHLGKPITRKALSDGEPLGPDDYEIGLRVASAKIDPEVEALWYRGTSPTSPTPPSMKLDS